MTLQFLADVSLLW